MPLEVLQLELSLGISMQQETPSGCKLSPIRDRK